ncbi:lipopolysaccharide biosynthesis protein, partial [Parabacteroides sp.]
MCENKIKQLLYHPTLNWLVFSNVIKSGSQWLILILLVKYFTTYDVGYFTYAMALSAPIFMLSELQLKSLIVVERYSGSSNFAVYNRLRIISTTIAATGLCLYCWIFNELNWVIVLVVANKSIESFIDIVYGLLQKENRMKWMSVSDIVKALLSFCLTFIFILLFDSINITLSALLFSSLIMCLVDYQYIYKQFPKCKNTLYSFKEYLSVFLKGLPLGISVFFGSYITNYPRLKIEDIMGPDLLAYFGAYSFMVIGIFQVQTPVQTLLRQRLSSLFHEGKIAEFNKKILLTMTGFILLGLLFLFFFLIFGDLIVGFLYKPEYIVYISVVYI